MNLVYLILPIALLIAAGFVTAFVWATRRGQFDDMDTPAMRLLGEDSEVDSKVDGDLPADGQVQGESPDAAVKPPSESE